MARCLRCGTEYSRRTVRQIHCDRCEREIAALTAPRPAPAFTPEWRRRGSAKDLSGSLR